MMDIGNHKYNFGKLDSIVNFLLLNGMKPHIELGQKPKLLTSSVSKIQSEEDGSQVFRSRGHWDEVLTALMEHLVSHYGQPELDSWRIEVWMDERTQKGKAAIDDYFDLFSHTVEIIRRYSKKIEIGGCGMRLGYDRIHDGDFFEQWSRQECQPDFVSMSSFAYEAREVNLARFPKRSTDSSFLPRQVRQVRRWMKKVGWEKKKLYVTEWNLTVSDWNYINDSCFKGAYIIRNVLDACHEADALAYYPASDSLREPYDFTGILHGGKGLLSKDGLLKPAGYSFEMLAHLYEYEIGKGENYLVTTDGNQHFSIVCHNQKELNHLYYLTQEDELEKERLWKYYEDTDSLKLQLILRGVEEREYQVKRYQVNETNGNLLHIWSELGYSTGLSWSDISYLHNACSMKLVIEKKRAEGGELKLDVNLSANEFISLDIR